MFTRDTYRNQERRRSLVLIAAGVFAIYLAASYLSVLWTDYLWFQSLGFGATFRTNLFTSALLWAAGFVVTFGFVWVNLIAANRLAPRFGILDLGPEEEVIERFRQWAEPFGRRLWFALAAVMGVLLGSGLSARREVFLAATHPVSFDAVDPQFGADLSFFVFRLPLWELLVSFATNLVVFTGALVVAVYFLNGGVRLGAGGRPVVRVGVKTHISVLAAVLALIRALAYHLDRYELLFRRNEGFFGAGFTDITARLPALNLLVLVAVAAAGLLLWNIRRSGWTLAWVSLGGWLLVALVAGVAYPLVIQRLQVDNDPFAREQTYIERNIEATRRAYGLTDVEVRAWAPEPNLVAADIEANAATFDNFRLWDPDVLTRTYQKNQEIRPYYRIDQVDTDRYTIDGELRQVMIAIRELEDGNAEIPTDWQNQRLIYTHGFGAVLNEAAVVGEDGQPQFVIQDVPPVINVPDIVLDQPRIYFGETYDSGRSVIVKTGTRAQEIDFPLAQGSAEYEYEGDGGVEMGSLVRRAGFALRYRDLNILISPQIRSDSRVVMHRNIRDIVDNLAPFLRADSDPYPVLVDGGVKWVIDMYTITGEYPYAEPVEGAQGDTQRLRRASGLPGVGGFNYIRNSVKAVIDAYDGSVAFYVTDRSDPLIASWSSIYPGMFSEGPIPAELADHLRYPQDLFTLQGEIYRDYHMDDVSEFFRRLDVWQIPADPSTVLRRPAELLWGDSPTTADWTKVDYLKQSLPTYLLLRLPGEEEPSYVLSQSFSPAGKINLSSILVADSSEGRYGRLVDYRLDRGSAVDGGGQVGQRIEGDEEFSAQFTLWRGQGSDVILGDMLLVPIEDSILYIQPVFLAAENLGGLPEFRRVIVAYGDTIEWGDSLDQALGLVFGTIAPDPGEPTDDDVAGLLESASAAFDAAREALTRGDLAAYQQLIERAEALIRQAAEQLASTTQAALPSRSLG